MKKIILIIIVFLGGIYFLYNKEKEPAYIKESDEIKGVFISYIDYSILKNKNEDSQKSIINNMVNNISNYGLNTIILQVRPFGDAIYKSNFFSSSHIVVKNEGDNLKIDTLEYFLKKSHEKGINLYAWINPYRIRNNADTDSLDKNSIISKWVNTNNIEVTEGGIYLNPASEEVLKLILSGLEEIVDNYDIDGVLYDDYFYPSKTIDLENYEEYIENKGTLSLDNYRKENINNLIKESYNTIKSINKNILFGLSPSGNIENNLNNEYLDIEYILNNQTFLDFIIPQLYYGFDNETKPYIETLNVWNNIIKTKTKLYIGLSIYKSGLEDTYAGTGKNEWMENNNIIKKQIIIARNKQNYEGFFVYRYDYLFKSTDNKLLQEEINNLKILIN